MAIVPGQKILVSDFSFIPRWFANTAERDVFFSANPGLKVAGAKAVIGSGSAMVEYVHNGSGWAVTYRPPQNFTPVATASSGAFTTVAATCRWSQVGAMVMATFSVGITAAGTASGNLLVTLPVQAANANLEHGSGRESAGTGAMLNAWISGPNACSVTGYDNVSRIANGRTYRWSIAYEAA